MKSRLPIGMLVALSWGVFALAMVWPTLALLGRCLTQGVSPDGGFTFSMRQLGLLWRSVWLAGAAAGLSLFISLPGAYVVGRLGGPSRRPLILGLLVAILLTPPMICAFGWEHVLPVGFNSYARCVGVWSLWAWPIPALIIGTGWSRAARSPHEAALLVASRSTAFLRVALPQLVPYVVLSVLIVFLLCFRDYSVPHACGLLVFSTELLGWARDSTHTIDTVWPSLLSVMVTGGAMLGAYVVWRRAAWAGDDDQSMAHGPEYGSAGSRRDILTLLALACFSVSWLLPLGALVGKLASSEAFGSALRTYGADLAWSLGLACGCGVTVVCMGLGLVACCRFRGWALGWSIAFGALPGALIGESLIAAYNYPSMWPVYDHWPIVALCFVARFGWVGPVTALMAVRVVSPQLVAQARIDGAGPAEVFSQILLPLSLPTLLCGGAIAAALSLAEVAASSLVRVPPFTLVSQVLIEKFHRFEYGLLVSLSLWLVAAALVPAVLLAIVLKRRRNL